MFDVGCPPRGAALRGSTFNARRVAQLYAVRCSPFFWPSITILAGGPSVYSGGLLRPFSRPAAWPRGAALRGLSHSMFDVRCSMPAAWRSFTRFDVRCPPRGEALRGSMLDARRVAKLYAVRCSPFFWPADRLHMVVAF